MKILITGVSGFVGSYLTKFFIRKGYEVSGIYRNHYPEQLEAIGCQLFCHDLRFPIKIKDSFDGIVHTASVQPKDCNDYCAHFEGNLLVANNILKWMKECNCSRIVNFSTRNIYGEVRKDVIDESNDIINPDIYGVTKYYAEKIIENETDIDSLSLRVPGIVGPGAHDIWLVNLVDKALNNEDIIVTDYYSHNFVWIENIAEFIDLSFRNWNKGEKLKYKVVNLSSNEGINNIDIAKEVVSRTNSHSKIIIKGNTEGLFYLKDDKAREMGYSSLSVMQIVDNYLKILGY